MVVPRQQTTSIWTEHLARPEFPRLDGDLRTEVAIVGAGITGMTAATLLSDAGRQVVVIDSRFVGAGDTGRTTSHLTEVLDGRYSRFRETFGREQTRLVAASQRDAIDTVAALAASHDVACDFEWVPAFLYAEGRDGAADLEIEAAAMADAGLAALLKANAPGLPFSTARAVALDRQAQVHPLKLLWGLADRLRARGVRFFDGTHAESVEDGSPCAVSTAFGTIQADAVVVATAVPVNDRVLLHTKLLPTRTYVVEGVGELPPGLFWDTADPYHYIRRHDFADGTHLIIGGADHRVGEREAAEHAFVDLDAYATAHFPGLRIGRRWSGQIVSPIDGLAYIGRNPLDRHVYVSTGYAGNGMTLGALGGRIVADLIMGRSNPYADLYSPSRLPGLRDVPSYIEENAAFPRTVLRDRLTNANADEGTEASIRPGEGRVIVVNGTKAAVARDRDGGLHRVSAVCTHMGCDVAWNAAEGTWDCGCHGSRFDVDGRVLNGPAVTALGEA